MLKEFFDNTTILLKYLSTLHDKIHVLYGRFGDQPAGGRRAHARDGPPGACAPAASLVGRDVKECAGPG